MLLVRGSAIVAGVLCLALSGCSDDGAGAKQPPTESPSVTVTAGPTDDSTADEAAVESTVDKFWIINVRSENRGITDPDQYAGVAEGAFVEGLIATAQRYKDSGVRRVGEPELGVQTVEVDGDQATSSMCIDHDRWGFKPRRADVTYPPQQGPRPWQGNLTRTADGWVLVSVEKGSLTC